MQGGEYSYATQPKAAPVKRASKYRDDEQSDGAANIMHDPRIIRGNTYSAKVITNTLNKDPAATKPTRSSNPAKKRFVGRRGGTPPPVEGRVHSTIQTEEFIEELSDRPVELDAETQTQQFMDRPISPLFIRAKTGKDVETQITPGDLFDFDLEVEPLLEILVGKTLQVAMLELMQEEELEAIRQQQEEFESIRNVELAEVKRLEAESRRKAHEKEQRVIQEKKRVADRRELEEKIAARSFAYQYLGSLHTTVFEMMEEQGIFYDPVKKEVEEIFVKGLTSSLRLRSSCYEAAAAMAVELVEAARTKARVFEGTALRLREEMYERIAREKALAEQQRLAAEAEAKRLAEIAAAAEEAGGEIVVDE